LEKAHKRIWRRKEKESKHFCQLMELPQETGEEDRITPKKWKKEEEAEVEEVEAPVKRTIKTQEVINFFPQF
jgi:hypothetical protein